ncbi:AAA family ATPase [Desulfovibrio sp. OttesenSCG-928-A18]|nr:AAA family ATPase [Desulfovibrio sp. OttesenSCG-928-A18]
MLELLRIRDLALIEDLEMEFAPGMNVLTGETGAGKTFILKALNFLTGERLGPDLIRPGKEKAVVEAMFMLDGQELILRRELSADTGRSRIYRNDQLCSQESVRDMRSRLLLHTSQHGQQKLLQSSFQAAILDDFMNEPALLDKKEVLVKALADCSSRLEALERSRLALEDKRTLLEYQSQEIAKVAPKAGEEEELEARRAVARNQEGISRNAAAGQAALHGGEDGPGLMHNLAALEKAVGALAGILEEFSDMPELLMDTRHAMQDLDARLQKAAGHADREADMDAIESRLYVLAQLKRKLQRPLDAILSLQKELRENLDFLDSCGIDRKALLREEEELCAELARLLASLNKAREGAAAALSEALARELRVLGFSEHLRVGFSFTPHCLYKEREDCAELRARLYWQPNPGQPPQPLDRIASGGELSRFLLALVSLMSKAASEKPTLIFDEVDAGVGGLTLNRVGESLEKLASERQMLLITHWPQLAARAKRHFVVSKEVIQGQTYTRCTRLAPEQIPAELARMSGNENA